MPCFSVAAESSCGQAVTSSLVFLPNCSSASLISSPPPCYSYTLSQSHKGMRGRRANKPVVVQRGRSEAQRHGDGGSRGNEVQSEAVMPLGPNHDSPVCLLACVTVIFLCVL